VSTEVRAYIRSLGLDAYVVGGAVRDELLGIPHKDEDFLVPGFDQEGLRAALSPHGRVEDLEVHGQLVGVRFYPRDPEIRALAQAGIEITPPRVEQTTGPGHTDFTIVADPAIPLEQDMARRDFTINAMARRLETGELIDPFGGVADLEQRRLRTVSPTSFRDDPLRLLRGLRLVSQLGFDLANGTLEQMRAEAGGIRYVSGERIGGGLGADGMGELSRLLLGSDPARALRIARDTGVLVAFLPEFEDVIGHDLGSDRQPVPLDEHVFLVVQQLADSDAGLAVRLAGLLHDLGKPEADRTGEKHAAVAASIAGRVLHRLRYPTRLRQRVVAIVASHAFHTEGPWTPARARRFLADHGDELAFDLVEHKLSDLRAKHVPEDELERTHELQRALGAERTSPHRISDLAVDGNDLLKLGFTEGPRLGEVLRLLLDDVIDDPSRNEREHLLERAQELA
jgi:tRNA nucleotidyltransferase (CCA-adding enzyme)